MSANRYTIVESVGNRIDPITSYDDLEKHHPSSGREAGRDYAEIDGSLEEIRPASGGRTLIKKDFVLLVNGSNRAVPVPSPVTGYVKIRRAFGTVAIHDAPGGKLLGQILHLDPSFKVKDGDHVEYGQPLGIQSGTGANGTSTYAIHVHAELEKSQFIQYISDLLDGTLTPNGPATTKFPAVNGWSYPFAGASGNPLANLTKLAKATSGFYPIGANGLWHGGVHFDQGTAGAFDQSSVRCIADGEVIAYRIDDTYPISEYIDGLPQCQRAPFSSGFVLVKHRLELPPLSSIPSAPAPPALTFYSLYMHLQDWAGYLAQPDLSRPSFWGEGIYQVKANTTDPVLGLNVRGHHRVPVEHAQYSAYRTILCTLPRGTRIEVDEASPDGNWLRLVNVTPLAAGLIAATGWVFKGQLKSLGGNGYLIAEQAKDVPASPQQGLNVRATANSGSDILAVLPHGTQVRISSEAAASKYHRLLEVVCGDPVPALTAKEDGELPGFVWRDSLESKSEPKTKDSVVVLDSPVPIKAGDLIGHLGLYQNHNEGSPNAILHLEVFSCDDVPAFIAQSRAHATRLPETQKTLLKIHKGASKLIPHHVGINATNPPKLSDDGVTVGVDLILPQSLLDSLPADAKLVVPACTGGTTCRTEIRWWRLDNLLADKDGNSISGWLAEQDMITTRHSPWEWEGYDFIEDSERPVGALAYHLEAMRRLDDSERASYQGVIDHSDKGPIKQRLHDILDSNGDKKIIAEEIRAALAKPWNAQSIAQLITRHESEWLWNTNKWDELDELMEHRSAEPNPDWDEEKKRIKTLSWWKELGGKHGIDAGGVAWHFQPLEIINKHKRSPQKLIWLKRVREIYGTEVSEQFREKVILTGKNLNIEPNYIMACIALETGRSFNPAIKNPKSSATGLIQFMDSTAKDLGTTTEHLSKMSHIEQMNYVERYFSMTAKNVGIPTSKWSLGDVYFSIFTPSIIKKLPSDTIYTKGQHAYEVNKFHDRNKDGIITKQDISENINTYYKAGLAYEE